MMNRCLSAEAVTQLLEGINLVLSRWAALQIAVENEWGGRDSQQKYQQLGHNLCLFFTQSKEQVYIDDVEDMLDDFMLSLNAEIEDGSIEEVAEKLMIMHEECSEGKFESIKRLKETNSPTVQYVRQPGSNNEEDEDEDGQRDGDEDGQRDADVNSNDMEVDDRPCQSSVGEEMKSPMEGAPQLEVDGWTVVSSKRNKGRKN